MIDVLRPAGRFGVRLDPANAKHYVAIVAGSGITPVLSILGAVLETEPASRFTLVYGNRNAGSVMFLEELADYKDRTRSACSSCTCSPARAATPSCSRGASTR